MTASDRLGIMLFLAAVFHAAILSMTFSFPDEDSKSAKVLPPLKIILVPQKTKEEIEDADFLAQENNEGSGNSEEKLRPQDKVTSPTVATQVGTEKETREAASPQKVKPLEKNVLVQDESVNKIQQVEESKPTEVVEDITADQIITRADEMMELTNELSFIQENQAKKPRVTHITSART